MFLVLVYYALMQCMGSNDSFCRILLCTIPNERLRITTFFKHNIETTSDSTVETTSHFNVVTTVYFNADSL